MRKMKITSQKSHQPEIFNILKQVFYFFLNIIVFFDL